MAYDYGPMNLMQFVHLLLALYNFEDLRCFMRCSFYVSMCVFERSTKHRCETINDFQTGYLIFGVSFSIYNVMSTSGFAVIWR